MSAKKSTPQGQQPDPFEDAFHRLLGRLVHAHARFDFNIGLQLNWMGSYCQQDATELLNPLKVQLGNRLKKLKQLILEIYEPAGAEALVAFKAWFKRADEARALRNDYVHGRWGMPGRTIDAEPLLAFIPLHWDMSPDRPDDSISMSIEEFASQVAAVEELFADYWRLTEKYKQYAKPNRPAIPT